MDDKELLRDDLRMDAYYYAFSETGQILVDRMLSSVALAGKAYHHTEFWSDDAEPWRSWQRGSSHVEFIQNAANDVAARLTALAEENERLKAERNKGEWTKDVPDECGRWYWMRDTESDNRWPMRLLTDVHGDPDCFGGTDGETETLDILEDGLVEIWSEPITEPALSEVPR